MPTMNARRGYMRLIYVLVIVAYAWTFVSNYASHRADAVKKGEGLEVGIRMASGAALPTAAGGAKPWLYLGAISQYVFVYDRDAGRARILPTNAIAAIEPIPGPDSNSGVVVAPIP